MRVLILAAALAAFSFPALAQQTRPQQQRPPAQQQPQQQAQPQQPAAPLPGMFACRTEAEICYIGIVLGGTQVSVLYSNDPKAEGIEEKPVAAQGASDLAQHAGRVVMLTGQYSAQGGLSNVQVVDVAGPLLSFAIKSMLSGQDEEEPEPPPPPPQRQQQPRQQQPRR